MKKTKTFEALSAGELEQQVNAWLNSQQEQASVTIVASHMNVSRSAGIAWYSLLLIVELGPLAEYCWEHRSPQGGGWFCQECLAAGLPNG